MEGMVESRREGGGPVVLGCLLVFMAKLSFIFVFQTQEKSLYETVADVPES